MFIFEAAGAGADIQARGGLHHVQQLPDGCTQLHDTGHCGSAGYAITNMRVAHRNIPCITTRDLVEGLVSTTLHRMHMGMLIPMLEHQSQNDCAA